VGKMHVEKRKVGGKNYFYALHKRKKIYLGKNLPVDFLPFFHKRKRKEEKLPMPYLFGKVRK